jgi:UPF0755 protein
MTETKKTAQRPRRWRWLAWAAGGLMVAGALGAWAVWMRYAPWFSTVSAQAPWVLEVEPGSGAWAAYLGAPLDAMHAQDSGWDSLAVPDPAPAAWTDQVRAALALRAWEARPGRYAFAGDETGADIARRLADGARETVELVVPAHRMPAVIASTVGKQVWADEKALSAAFASDSVMWRIRPNTYEVYWEISAEELVQKLLNASDAWWTPERLARAQALQLTPREVVVLASIVQEETHLLDEAPIVAGLYLNRLRTGMMLQADPTLKFALGDWSIQRLLDADKAVESPYNTYRYGGLPPGPIRVPESAYVDAVLQPAEHNHLFMCARADGQPGHAFAPDYATHLRNARAYQEMLNRNGIFR